MQITKNSKNYKQLQIKDRGKSDIFMEAHNQYQYLQFKQQEHNQLIAEVDQNQWICLSQVIEQLNKSDPLIKSIFLKIYGKIMNYVCLLEQSQLHVGFYYEWKQYLDIIWLTYQPLNQLDKLNEIQIFIIDLSKVSKNEKFLKFLIKELITDKNIYDEILQNTHNEDEQLKLVALDQYIEFNLQQTLQQYNKNSYKRIVFNSSKLIICDNIIEYFKQNYKQFKDYFIRQMENYLQIDISEYIQLLDQIIFNDKDQILDNLEIEKGIFELDNFYLLKISFVFIIGELKMDGNDLFKLCIGLINYNYDEIIFKESMKQQYLQLDNQKQLFQQKIMNNIKQFCEFANIDNEFHEKIEDQFQSKVQMSVHFGYLQNYIVQEILQDKMLKSQEISFLEAEKSYFAEMFQTYPFYDFFIIYFSRIMQQFYAEDVKIVRIPCNEENLKVCKAQDLEIDNFETFFEHKNIVLKFDLNYWINYQTVLQLQKESNDKSQYVSGKQIIQIFIQLIRNIQLLEKNNILIQFILNQDIWIKYKKSDSQECHGIIKTVILSQDFKVQQNLYLSIIKIKIKENSFFNKEITSQVQQLYDIYQLHSYLIDKCLKDQNNKPQKEILYWSIELFKNQYQLITMLETEIYNQVPDSLLHFCYNNYNINDLKSKVHHIQQKINLIIGKYVQHITFYDTIYDQDKLGQEQINKNTTTAFTHYFYSLLKFDCKLNYLELFSKTEISIITPTEAKEVISIIKYVIIHHKQGFKHQSYKYKYYVFWIIMQINQNIIEFETQMIDTLYYNTEQKIKSYFQVFVQSLLKDMDLNQKLEDIIISFIMSQGLDYIYEKMFNEEISYQDDKRINQIINQYYKSYLKQSIFLKLQEEINKL